MPKLIYLTVSLTEAGAWFDVARFTTENAAQHEAHNRRVDTAARTEVFKCLHVVTYLPLNATKEPTP